MRVFGGSVGMLTICFLLRCGICNFKALSMKSMRKIIAPTLASLLLLGMLSACSPYRAKKKAPTKSGGLSMFDFRRAHCGCVGK